MRGIFSFEKRSEKSCAKPSFSSLLQRMITAQISRALGVGVRVSPVQSGFAACGLIDCRFAGVRGRGGGGIS